jgi:radical SAM-linked protein
MEDINTTSPNPPSQQPVLTRIRVTFSKSGSLIYTGALDLQKLWERVLRRAELKVAYTQGFSPGPRINLASALPLGVTGENELADFWFTEAPDLDTFCEKVNRSSPPGLHALQAEFVPLSTPALQTRVDSSEYRTGLFPAEQLPGIIESVKSILEAETIPRERRGKPYDLRPLILGLVLHPNENGSGVLEMHLKAREGATGRADEVLAVLGLEPASVSLSRVGIHLQPE